jgi:uncharacterized membrane protein YqiK
MDISLKTIEVDRQAQNGLICKDNIRADIKVTFFIRVNNNVDDVLRVATSVGVIRASDRKTLEELFQAKFSEALKTVGKRMDFVDLYNQRDQFKDEIMKVIGRDLSGYSLEDAAIDYIEQTKLDQLDPDNILDSEGRKKIIELTSIQRMRANEIEREAEKVITKQNVETREAVLALQRQQAEAEARQAREIATTKAREIAEQRRVEAEEHKRSEEARIQVEQELNVQRENANREIQIAAKNREGAVLVENERVLKNQMLEQIARERAMELTRIEKEKAIAVEQRNIAEVVRERVAVEKTVAEEEERINDVRVIAEANRAKNAAVIKAQQDAEQLKIKEVQQAEAAAVAAQSIAKEKLTLADAEQIAAEKETQARIRRAEGAQAEAAAAGIAQARVKEMDAVATEKQGLAKARVLEAEAEAAKKRGLAEVAVETAKADAVEKMGHADAQAVEQKMMAEAKGLHEKAAAMAKLNESSRAHEEFRIKANNQLAVAKAGIDAQVQVAASNAQTLAAALANAKFDIVGGDGAFFERFVNAVSLGKSIDATVHKSEVLGKVTEEYRDGSRSLPDDLKQVLSGLKTGDVANLALAKALTSAEPGALKGLIDSLKGAAQG